MIWPFREVAADFRLIEDEGVGVIMPGFGEDQESVAHLLDELRYSPFPQSAARKLQRYSVVVRTRVLQDLQRAGGVEMIHGTYPVLVNAAAYDRDLGFCEDMAEIWDVESLFF